MTGGRVERRLAAVLAADVAGYSRLMGADEVGTLTALKAHRREVVDPEIAEHHGRIVKTTGDGLLVEFASAVDAVTCAMAVQTKMAKRNSDAVQKIAFRIGINIGDVIIEGDDIFGDGVNIAARVENECEPGGVYLSASAFEQVRGKTSFGFDDLGEKSLKNIDRPVRLCAVQPAMRSAATAGATAETTKPLALPDKPSIAVLPFQNMSGDPEQEYFADGMVEDIITALSRFKSLFVIARNSSFTYRGKAVDIKQVGRELGVRYVLEGSVRKAGNRLRITGQLVDAVSGGHIWAERYDRALNDVFVLQDELATHVVGAIEPSLRQAEIERARRKRPDNLGAYDLYLRALPDAFSGNPEPATRALPLLERAVAIDPDYAAAHAAIALCHHIQYQRGSRREQEKDAALRHARIALARAGDDATTLGAAAFVIGSEEQDYESAFDAFDRAIGSTPSCFMALSFGSMIYAWAGSYEKAVEYGERAIRLSPRDLALHLPYNGLAYAHYFAGDFERAAAAAKQSARVNPGFGPPLSVQTAALARLGRQDETRASARRLLELVPNFTIRRLLASGFSSADHRVKLAEGLRLAEIPE
ncbi:MULTISPECIES: adenylate/guanylate cyclase domain-containing protein [unclassified Bradyrhizobium]|uniref:adenylate/guanylate cyclase domain-containing protein n=1 Tax=unclassified Bradyrhizobium TaxID=2631580 RepID=UPI0024783617|nr:MULTISPECIES: adenylate/guanylate cyclase domain-containing protein [unclassified Bradyrhizobium]WGS18781.1 transcriptional regulator [Bradyrhizobium sp. ISRA463]WGS25606.1 transcriptional regulator [Bradyrhizobium sp. ISRA464]